MSSKACFLALILIGQAFGQTTQGLISGSIIDSVSGAPIIGAEVRYRNLTLNTEGFARVHATGEYIAPLLTPGEYRLRASASGYQAQEVQQLQLPVAGRLSVQFRLRPLQDVWESGQYRSVFLPNSETVLTFYGPDVDTSRASSFQPERGARTELEPTVSYVINPQEVRELPLSGRDLYAAIVALPGVTTYGGTARGLGVSANGQRPSASNYLVDGLENNNYLVTGPLTAIAPEAMQEYRVSTNNYSAEYGRTSGFVANAITRSGTATWHLTGYFYLKNDALNANGYQQKVNGVSRPPLTQSQPGFVTSGPLWPKRLLASFSFEYLRSRTKNDPVTYFLPTAEFLATLPQSSGADLFRRFPALAVPSGAGQFAAVSLKSTSSLDRYLGLPRLDYQSSGGAHRIFARFSVSQLRQPDFVPSPFRGLDAPFRQGAVSLAVGSTSTISPTVTNEARFGRSGDGMRLTRPHPEVPAIFVADSLTPPSSSVFDYRNKGQNWELVDNVLWTGGRHVLKAGGGVLWRRLEGSFLVDANGLYRFEDSVGLADSMPTVLFQELSRAAFPSLLQAQPERRYRYSQYYLFAQDSYQANRRLVINYGIRYENFGAPVKVGKNADTLVEFGQGNSFPERIATAKLVVPSGAHRLFDSDPGDVAGRFGFSYDLTARSRTLLRGSYGIFYDRPFDNLWQAIAENSFVTAGSNLTGVVNLQQPAFQVGLRFPPDENQFQFPRGFLAFQPGLRNARVQSAFLGVQHQFANSLVGEINGLGSLGRHLLTTDQVNRDYSVVPSFTNPIGKFNPDLPLLYYRANQGKSTYYALAASLRFRFTRASGQVSYTLSRSFDLQSEPLANDFDNFNFLNSSQRGGTRYFSAFTRQFDSQADRGPSDFDQRHNLVFFGTFDPFRARGGTWGRLLANWQVSTLGAVRSGFPYSVYALAPSTIGVTDQLNSRADLVPGVPITLDHYLIPGGRQILNPAAFSAPLAGYVGTTGRNSFSGPGVFNIDLSLGRRFSVPRLREGSTFMLRLDAFNALNHANLNNPYSTQLESRFFGYSFYGRQERNLGFPLLVPFSETARSLQLLLRFEF